MEIKTIFLLVTAVNLTWFQMANAEDKLLCDFKEASQKSQWNIINDGVMGGVSTSTFTIHADHTATFTGSVSLENNGGFASVRGGPFEFKLKDFSGLRIRVKGDGKTYSLRLRTDTFFDGPNYRVKFETVADEWMVVDLPFHTFVATFRGRILTNAPPLDPDKIKQIGLLISDKQAGPFRLHIDWIAAYQAAGQP
jgi:monofunctional biosynthetic peptidoglycan transglycosylase